MQCRRQLQPWLLQGNDLQAAPCDSKSISISITCAACCRLYRCVARYGYLDVPDLGHEFQKQLVSAICRLFDSEQRSLDAPSSPAKATGHEVKLPHGTCLPALRCRTCFDMPHPMPQHHMCSVNDFVNARALSACMMIAQACWPDHGLSQVEAQGSYLARETPLPVSSTAGQPEEEDGMHSHRGSYNEASRQPQAPGTSGAVIVVPWQVAAAAAT